MDVSQSIPPRESWFTLFRTSLYAETVAWMDRKVPRLSFRLRRLSGTRAWGPLLAVGACVLAAFMSFQPWPLNHPDWDNYELKAAAPLRSMAAISPPGSHAANLDFRLTVPLIAKALGLKRWGFRGLYLLLTLGTLWLCYACFLKWSGDRAAASLFTVAVAAIPPGSEALYGRFFYDPAAFFLGLLCLTVRRPLVLAPCLFMLAFVDERALLMFPAVWLHHAAARRDSALFWNGALARRVGGAVLVALVAYFVTRFWLSRHYGLSMPLSRTNAGLICLKVNFRFFEWMALATLEFFWLLLLPLLWRLWKSGHRALCLGYLLCMAGPLLGALYVRDVGRSMNYLFPAFVSLVGLSPLFFRRDTLRSMLLAVAALNLLFWNVDYINEPKPGAPAVFETARFLMPTLLPPATDTHPSS